MRALWPVVAVAIALPAFPQQRGEPRAASIDPFVGQRGTSFAATVRGTGLSGARAASTGEAPFTVAIEGASVEPANEASGRKTGPTDLIRIRVDVRPDAKPGRYPIRLIGANGISNALALQVVDVPVVAEPAGTHDVRDAAVAVSKVPAIFAGRLGTRGETDYYTFHAEAGQTLTFEAISGLPQIASGGSAATVANFDPALTIYEPAGSWFNPKRLNRIDYNDEPVWVFGKPTDAYLVRRFAKAGDYWLRVEAFAGQGGPDYSYALRIAPGASPQTPTATAREGWQERSWTRRLSATRLNELASRGGTEGKYPAVETYRAAPEPVTFKIPGTLEGALAKPGETHRARFHVDKPADVAMEFETPAAAPPYFNPVFRLLNPSGEEVASNVYAGKGACSGAMTKTPEAKTVIPLRDTGDYTIEIRDATADLAGPDFQYRLQVRPQVPHVGEIAVDADKVNLAQGQAKIVRVTFDREEDYRGAVTVATESLPPGVSAVAGADFEPEKDGPQNAGKRERYTPRPERLAVALTAAPDAAVSKEPQEIRFVVRPLVDGKPGDVLLSKTIPLMVIPKP